MWAICRYEGKFGDVPIEVVRPIGRPDTDFPAKDWQDPYLRDSRQAEGYNIRLLRGPEPGFLCFYGKEGSEGGFPVVKSGAQPDTPPLL